MENVSSYFDTVVKMAIAYAPKILGALAILLIGFWVIKRVRMMVSKSLQVANFSEDLSPFLVTMVDFGMKALLLFSVAGVVGIDTASFVAVLAAAGFAVGLALQGSLGNFAAGIIVLVFRPYKVGDWVEVQGKFGRVESIQIFNTVIITPGQKQLIVPNGKAIDDVITNFSSKGKIRIELQVTMSYEANFPFVKQVILDALRSIDSIYQEPEPQVGIESFDTHVVVLSVRPFINPDHYWQAISDSYQAIKAAFNTNGIKIAYPEGVEMGVIGG